MVYRKMGNSLGFANLAMASSLKHNRSLKRMNTLNDTIDWNRVEQILMDHHTVGASGEGVAAYPPLMLFKCMLLQKWFRINYDPKLENQINDRLSFKSKRLINHTLGGSAQHGLVNSVWQQCEKV
ncbi:transposase [Desulfosarcina ovata]|uniref:Transposase InsH N-terminal domain-containing protein n=1 Tax=Desulfosarcina ovata subsp. ovata TaxID=2752305 RepID=A0A5K8A7B7_9BACT|nr:transposase [Desulfosarcina ovata]BBO88523.1 hypothetical protein DSCOOX_17030 [Desulfosarcina ovata subsp. ovata]